MEPRAKREKGPRNARELAQNDVEAAVQHGLHAVEEAFLPLRRVVEREVRGRDVLDSELLAELDLQPHFGQAPKARHSAPIAAHSVMWTTRHDTAATALVEASEARWGNLMSKPLHLQTRIDHNIGLQAPISIR